MRTIDEINAEADQLLANFTPPGVDPYIWDPSQWDRSREHEGKLGWVGLITRQPFYVPAQWVQERLTADKSMWVDDPEVETHLKDLIREALRHQLPADVSDDELSAQMTHNFYEIAYKGSRSFAEIKPDRPLTGGRVDVDELAATAQARLSGQQPSAKPKAAKPPKAKRPKRDGRGKPKPPAPPTPVTIGSGGLDPDIAALRSVAEKAIERLRSI